MTQDLILLIEDNPDDEALTLRALKKNNIANEVVVARDGAEALEVLFHQGAHAHRAPTLPALVLLDLNLPKIDGLGVLKRIRAEERTKMLPVVVLTSSKQDDDIVASYSNGANAYVRKPVEFADFMEAMKTLGMFWLILNERAPHRPVRE